MINPTELIGNTPLVYLKKVSLMTGCHIYGKCEFLNPGGSVKDRPALYMVQQVIKNKLLEPGGSIVDGTAGNTGIGLALVANYYGFGCKIVIPRTQTEEKKAILRACGAELIEVDAVPYKDPNNYIRYAGRLAQELNKNTPGSAYWTNQFDNQDNRMSHYLYTAKEIWQQTNGEIDGFVCSIGTGGTMGGVSKFLKEQLKPVTIGLADPHGSAMHNYYTKGELSSQGSSLTEGIGQGRITENLVDTKVDVSWSISDDEALGMMFDTIKSEGLFIGSSSGINIAGAVRMAKHLGTGKTIVTLLCDGGAKYLTKIFDKDRLAENDISAPDWL